MNQTQLLMHFLCGYIFLNLDEDGNTTLDCTSIAIQLGVKKNQVEYALASLVLDKFCNPFAFQLQSFCRLTLYDTKGCEVSVANKLQRFCRVVAHLDINYENLKKSNNETLENNKISGATDTKTDEVDNSIYNIYNIPSSNNRGVGEEEEKNKIEKSKPEKSKSEVDFEKVLDIFTSTCKALPVPSKLSDKRKAGISARFAELQADYPDFNPYDLIKRICEKVEESDFLSGRSGEWKASFDWIFCYKNNYIKVIEGNYDNAKEAKEEKKTDLQLQHEAEWALQERAERNMRELYESMLKRRDHDMQAYVETMMRKEKLSEEEIRAKYAAEIEKRRKMWEERLK